MRLDKRIKYRIVLDTETCPLDTTLTEVNPQNMFVYDIGWAVVDKRGKVYQTRSFINSDIFLDEKELMKSAYYASKIPNYWAEIKSGDRLLKSWSNIRKALLEDITAFNVTEIYAHNMYFDLSCLNNTARWLSKSKYRYYFPKSVDICDTLAMARSVIAKMPTYKKFCIKNGYLTKNNQVRLTAEILYRFITQDITFNESHTALEDVMIEKEIMAYCFRRHKKMKRVLYKGKAEGG
jgi:hypothetical protein